MTSIILGRRQFMAGAASLSALALAGCATTTPRIETPAAPVRHAVPPEVQMMYGPVYDEPYPLRAADMSLIDPGGLRLVGARSYCLQARLAALDPALRDDRPAA
jgi:hypothetical protein